MHEVSRGAVQHEEIDRTSQPLAKSIRDVLTQTVHGVRWLRFQQDGHVDVAAAGGRTARDAAEDIGGEHVVLAECKEGPHGVHDEVAVAGIHSRIIRPWVWRDAAVVSSDLGRRVGYRCRPRAWSCMVRAARRGPIRNLKIKTRVESLVLAAPAALEEPGA